MFNFFHNYLLFISSKIILLDFLKFLSVFWAVKKNQNYVFTI